MAGRSWIHDVNVDLGRVRGQVAIGLRDGALLALLAAGLNYTQIAALLCSAVTRHSTGRLMVSRCADGWICTKLLAPDQSARLIAWLAELGDWGENAPLFPGRNNRPLGRRGLQKIVERYRRPRRRG